MHRSFGPRLEAKVFERDRLVPSQADVADAIVELLEQMAAESLPPPTLGEAFPFAARTDPERRNRVALIDGSRGAGKTTILVSLVDAFARHALLSDDRRLGYRLREARRIVPLTLLDLQPIPDGANLLALVLGRLRAVAEWLGGEDPCAAPWDVAGPEGSALDRRWEALAEALAGWEGNLERKRRLDPHVYALELAEQAQAGIGLEPRFRQFVDQLASEWKRRPGHKGHEPLFLVPVDDADMNPRRALELLTLTRILYHPRLAFLLTGDSSLFESALRAHQVGEIFQPLSALDPGWAQIRRLEPDGAIDLAIEYYDRAIPPHHRKQVRPIREQDRLDEIWSEGSGASADSPRRYAGTRLHDVLAKLEVELHGQRLDLYRLFTLDSARPSRLASLLPDRLRTLQDFIRMVRDLVDVEHAGAARVTAELWKHAVRRSGHASSERDRLRRVVTADLDAPQDALVVAAGELSIERAFRLLAVHEVDRWRELRVQVPAEARLLLRGSRVRGEAEIPLHPSLLPALQLACDVAATREAAFLGASPAPRAFAGLFARAVYDSQRFGPLELPWPQPEWEAFAPSDLLDVSWAAIARARQTTPKITTVVLADYLQAVALADSLQPMTADALRPVSEAEEAASSLVEVLERALPPAGGAVGEGTPTATTALRRWAETRLPLLCAPEYGLSDRAAAALWGRLSAAYATPETTEARSREQAILAFRQKVRRLRRERLRAALIQSGLDDPAEADLVALETEISDRFPGYPISAPSSRGGLVVELRNFPVEQTDPFVRRLPETLGEYLQTPKREALARDIHPNLHRLLAEVAQRALDHGSRAWDAVLAIWSLLRGETAAARDAFDPARLAVGWEIGRSQVDWRGAIDDPGKPWFVRLWRTDTELTKKGTRELLDPATELFARVITDLAVDLGPEQTMPITFDTPGQWDGLGIEYIGIDGPEGASSVVTHWPVPRWPALYDWELLDARWQNVLRCVPAAWSEGASWLDRLAFELLSTTRSMALQRHVDPSVTSLVAPTPEDWKTLLAELTEQRTEYQSARFSAWKRWRDRRLALFAAPESALSPEVAELVLDAVGSGSRSGRERESMRLMTLTDCGLSRNTARKALTQIDQSAGPDHPWARRRALGKT